MLPDIEPATEEREGEILTFCGGMDLEPPLHVWERAFGPGCPPELAARPWVAHLRGRGVTGFATTHDLQVYINGEDVKGLLLNGLIVAPGKEGEEAARSLFEHLAPMAPLLFGVAASADSLRMFRMWNWRFVAELTRWRVDPVRKGAKGGQGDSPRELGEPHLDTTALEVTLTGEGARFFRRTDLRESYLSAHRGQGKTRWFSFPLEGEGEGWLRLRRVPSTGKSGREWLVEDIRAPLGSDAPLAATLARIAGDSGHPVYTSFLRPSLGAALEALGDVAVRLEPRWGLFSMIGRGGSPSLARELDSTGPWALSPADLDLDLA